MTATGGFARGGCTCRAVRYRMDSAPMFVHCCHCRWCQRETGTAFALNAMIETDRLFVVDGEPESIRIPSESGKGQSIARCPACRIALWSHYAGAGRAVAFVRVGTLDKPELCPPDVHIFVESKQPWLSLGDQRPLFERYYDRKALWPAASLARLDAVRN